MKIKSIKVQNYGVHRKLHVDLEEEIGKLVFVNGSNNHGKTSFLEAISFGLFGSEISGKKVSRAAIAELAPDAPCEVSVQIDLYLDSGEEARIYRSQYFTSQGNADYFAKGDPKLRVTLVNPNLSEVNEDLNGALAEDWLDEHVPVRFRDFIIFNGEKLEEFLSSGIQKAVENSVRQVARLDYFESVRESLRGIKRGLESERARLSKKETAISSTKAFNDAEDELNLAKKQLSDLETQREIAQETKDKLQPHFEKAGVAQEERDEYGRVAETINQLKIKQTENQVEIRRLQWTYSLGQYLVRAASSSLSHAIEKAHENHEMPLNFTPEALQSLLVAGECICGRELTGGTQEASNINQHIKETEIKKVWGGELQSVQDSVRIKTAIHVEKRIQLNKFLETRKKLAGDRRTQESKLEELGKAIANTPISGFHQGADYTKAVNALGNLDGEFIPAAKLRLSTAEREYERAKEAMDADTGSDKLVQNLSTKIDFLDRVITQSQDFGDEILDTIKEQLENYLTEKFAGPDEGRYVTKITEDFELVTSNLDGSSTDLSAGQRMLRAYFFSFALRSVVGMNIPLIVDSPIARLDGGNKELMIRGLLEIFEGPYRDKQQAVFMMTDSEYTPKVAKIFKSKFEPTVFYLEHFPGPREFSNLQVGIDPKWKQYEFGPWYVGAKKGESQSG